jgi:hypothetical protein
MLITAHLPLAPRSWTLVAGFVRTRSLSAFLPAVIAAGILTGCGKKEADAPPAVATAAAVNATNMPAPAATENLAFAKLPGKWLRPDGGYILEIRSVDGASGKLEAAYLNPRPINVSKAQASRDGGSLKVFIELRDVNYPGSTYTLTYDPASDQLKGDYFQAALKQTFDVIFTRVQP